MGFKNAPKITEFKRGMVVRFKGCDYIVVHVTLQRGAISVNSSVLSRDEIPEIELDLDSIWEGQCRYGSETSVPAIVVATSNDFNAVVYKVGSVIASSTTHNLYKKYPWILMADNAEKSGE